MGLSSLFVAHLAYAYAFIEPLYSRLLELDILLSFTAMLILSASVSLVIYHKNLNMISMSFREAQLSPTLS